MLFSILAFGENPYLFAILVAMYLPLSALVTFVVRWSLAWPKKRTGAWILFALVAFFLICAPLYVDKVLILTFCLLPVGLIRRRKRTDSVQLKTMPMLPGLASNSVFLDVLGIVSISILLFLAVLGFAEWESFLFFFGHLALYMWPIALPLLVAMVLTSTRLIYHILSKVLSRGRSSTTG